MTREKIKVFIVDDHLIVINGIIQSLSSQLDFEVVGYAHHSDDALAWLETNTPDVILLDIQLPGTDGIDLCKILRKMHPELKIIGLTTFSQVSFITEMLRNGANGYLYKNTSEEELMDAIRKVYRGERYLSAEVNQKLVAKAMSKTERAFIPKLTRREKEVFELIMEEYTNQEIADTLYLSVSTVETHRMNLCAKLDARNAAGLVKKAMKFGLV